MLRPLQLLLGFGASPFLLCKPRGLVAIPKIASLSASGGANSTQKTLLPTSCSRPGGCFKAFRMSSSGSDANPDSGFGPGPAVAPPLVPKPKVRFCQSCGSPTEQVIPDGEEKLRAVCTVCGRIHYENPKMVVGCLVEHENKILLCKRKIEPSYGFWTLPAGFLEIGESAAEGATRETLEEACAEVEILSPFAQLDIPLIGQYRVI